MITHIVLFKLVHSDEKSIEAARTALAGLRGADSTIAPSGGRGQYRPLQTARMIWPWWPSSTPWKICRATRTIRSM